MRKVKLLFAALALLSLPANADNLVVQKLDQTELRQAIEAIGRLEFDLHEQEAQNEENQVEEIVPDLLLIGKDGQLLATVPVDDVRKIYFADNESALEQLSNTLNVVVDADNGCLRVEGTDLTETLRVFDMSGKLLLTQVGNTVYVGALPKGVYLLQCGMNVVKFSK